MTIIEFKKKEETEPHLSGDAICLGCKYKFVAVVPVGMTEFSCPSCESNRAIMANPVAPDIAWLCNCGSFLFFVTKDGCMCRECGLYANL
jgi:hypothetical protein